MESGWDILFEIIIILGAAFVFGTLAELLKQNAIVGYMLGGMLVGPYGFHIIGSQAHMEAIAEFGVALLLFSIGLEFSLGRLMRLGPSALFGGLLQVALTWGATAAAITLLSGNWKSGLFFGAMTALSSTACVLRVLSDRAALDSGYGRGALGTLLVQDIAVLPIALALTLVAGSDAFEEITITAAANKAFLAAGAIFGFYAIFGHLIPRLLSRRPWGRNRELPTLLAVAMAGGAAIAAHHLGVSPAFGALIAGLLAAGSPFAVQIRADVASLRTLLVTLFFASIGMMGDPALAFRNWPMALALVVAVVAGKSLLAGGALRVLRSPLGMSLASGLCVAQIGEFSFVLAKLGRGSVISEEAFQLFVIVAIATLFATPYLISAAPAAAALAERLQARLGDGPLASPSPAAAEDVVLIIGFGPAGQSAAEALCPEFKSRLAVLDLNAKNAAQAARYGLHFLAGDATQSDVLEHAGVHHARAVVITLPDAAESERVIEICRDLNPNAAIIARGRYHKFAEELRAAGATVVVDEESQVGRRISEETIRLLQA